MDAQRYVHFFGDGRAEDSARMKDLIGSMGANLTEMVNIGIPVPPGFTISTEACTHYYANDGEYPGGLEAEIDENLARFQIGLSGVDSSLLCMYRRKLHHNRHVVLLWAGYVRSTGAAKPNAKTLCTGSGLKSGV